MQDKPVCVAYMTHIKNMNGYLCITKVCDFIMMYFHQWRNLIFWRPERLFAIATRN